MSKLTSEEIAEINLIKNYPRLDNLLTWMTMVRPDVFPPSKSINDSDDPDA